jgi:hypothetical protein
MEANLYNLFYLFFRLSPFIVACFFSLISIFNSDMKGLIYLVGLIFSIAITWLFGRSIITTNNLERIGIDFGKGSENPVQVEENGIPNVCNFLSLGGFHSFSKVPLGLAVLSYTFFYLLFTISSYHMEIFNLPTLILFPILLLADIWWNISNGCFPVVSCLMSLIVAGGLGVGWSAFVQQNMPNLQYLMVGSNRNMCMKPSETYFTCEDVDAQT